ncbi:hypothetical protein EVAR_89808_1 [Eumeta japonica]|uniref:Uncharacterized protein n=1 Tax=Eumeta variegata TaxID=151549 RepID=A0A4C1YG24_EUMVA|nr:hypothetical protein EVAR_89808_1 [Eumeta japonica]
MINKCEWRATQDQSYAVADLYLTYRSTLENNSLYPDALGFRVTDIRVRIKFRSLTEHITTELRLGYLALDANNGHKVFIVGVDVETRSVCKFETSLTP